MNDQRCFQCDREINEGSSRTIDEVEVQFCGTGCVEEFDHRNDNSITIVTVVDSKQRHVILV